MNRRARKRCASARSRSPNRPAGTVGDGVCDGGHAGSAVSARNALSRSAVTGVSSSR